MAEWILIFFWALVATAAMTLILDLSQRLGLSRLSLPYLFGTFFSADRSRAYFFGFLSYFLGGLMFALLYWLGFTAIGWSSWWLGALVGLLHGLFLLAVMLPVMPYLHPRMATAYDGPTAFRRIEPPGFLGLNYGTRTPLVTLLGQLVYGLILGSFLPVGG